MVLHFMEFISNQFYFISWENILTLSLTPSFLILLYFISFKLTSLLLNLLNPQRHAATRLQTLARSFSSSKMAPIPPKSTHYDYLVIGGGSGGVASARRAAKYGAKTLLIEAKAMGGTCVNAGCVPKKVMWAASDTAKRIREAKAYGFDVDRSLALTFDWPGFKAKRDAYVKRLNGIYERNLEKEGVEYVYGWAKFVDSKTIEVEYNTPIDGVKSQSFTADNILVTAGGAAKIPDGIPGAEYGITSDGFFELETQPKKVAIVGAGYIGVELAGVFNGLGTETHLFIRGETVLRVFDDIIQDTITETYIKHGVHIHKKSEAFTNVEKLENGQLKISYKDEAGKNEIVVDSLVWTIGRKPLSEILNLDDAGIKYDEKGQIIVDEFQNTNVPGIYSLGDIVGNVELTPVAIAAGRKLSNRLFGGDEFKDSKLDYENVPSAIFSHPESASIGLSEAAAKKKYGAENVKAYRSKFISMYYAPLDPEDKDPTVYKIVVTGKDEKVVGLHLVGDASSEILQGFGAAIKMGATKADFDNVVAIHPTSAEEIVTMT